MPYIYPKQPEFLSLLAWQTLGPWVALLLFLSDTFCGPKYGNMGPQIPAYDLKPKSSKGLLNILPISASASSPSLVWPEIRDFHFAPTWTLARLPYHFWRDQGHFMDLPHGLTPHLHPRTSLQLENSLKKTPISFNFPNLVTTKVPFSASRFPGSHRNSRVAIWARGKFPAVVGSIFGSPSDRSWDPMLRQPHRQGLDLFCLGGRYMRGHWWFQGFLINLRNITFT